MSGKIPVHAARIPDRDRLLGELLEAGLDAKPVGEVEIMVTASGDAPDTADEVYAMVERMIMTRRRALRADQARGRDLHPPPGELAAASARLTSHSRHGFVTLV